jgi:hypothetical protein
MTTLQEAEKASRGIGLFTMKVECNVLDSLTPCVSTSDLDNQRPILKSSVNNYQDSWRAGPQLTHAILLIY